MAQMNIKTGKGNCLFITFDVFNMDFLEDLTKDQHIIKITDSLFFCFNGIYSKTKNMTETIGLLNEYIDNNKIKNVFLFGICRGSYTAMLIGQYIRKCYIFVVEPIFSIDYNENLKINDERFTTEIHDKMRKIGLLKNPEFIGKLNVFSNMKDKRNKIYVYYSTCEICKKQLTLMKKKYVEEFCLENEKEHKMYDIYEEMIKKKIIEILK